MASRTAGTATLLAALLVALVACGTRTDDGTSSGERVPITPRAVAAIALDHLPGDTSRQEEMYTDGRDAPGTIGVDFQYGATGGYDGDLVRVALAPGERNLDCANSHCASLATDVEGAEVVLVWEEIVPEEDPGIVTVLLYRDGEKSWVYQAGPTITGDPRRLDLPVTVEDMVEIVEDPRLRLETTPEAIAAGRDLEDWG